MLLVCANILLSFVILACEHHKQEKKEKKSFMSFMALLFSDSLLHSPDSKLLESLSTRENHIYNVVDNEKNRKAVSTLTMTLKMRIKVLRKTLRNYVEGKGEGMRKNDFWFRKLEFVRKLCQGIFI